MPIWQIMNKKKKKILTYVHNAYSLSNFLVYLDFTQLDVNKHETELEKANLYMCFKSCR